MNEVQKLLVEGHADKAMARFVNLLRHDPQQTASLAKGLTAALVDLYNRNSAAPVEEFYRLLPVSLPGPIADAMMSILRPLIDRTRHWRQELEQVTRERLARETRAAVTTQDLRAAVQRSVALLRRGESTGEGRQLVRYLAQALASLTRDRERATAVIRDVARERSVRDLAAELIPIFEEAAATQKPGAMEESDRQWTSILNAAVTSIRDFCPEPRSLGEPTPEELQRFTNEVMALLRAGFGSDDEEAMIDALSVMVEFCPTDPPELESVAGVEPRMFLALGPRAKLTAVRALARIGESESLRRRVLALARSRASEGRAGLLASVMGGLRHGDFIPWLREAMKRAKTPLAEEPVVDALGRIADPQAVDLLLHALSESMKKAIEPKQGRRAKMLLTALGRIGRAKDLDPALRGKIVGQVIRCVAERFASLSFFAAAQMFSVNAQDMAADQRDWAVKATIRAMFRRDTGEDMRAAARSPLGFRRPMVTALVRLGKDSLPAMLREATPHATTFSGAFPAFAEVLEQVGDERATGVLDTMIRTAFLQPDDEGKDRLLTEKVQDAGTGEMRTLNRDDILHTLLFTLEKIGGEEGRRLVLAYADQVQTGQLASPGPGTASFLFETKMKQGTLGKREQDDGRAVKVDAKEVEKAVAAAKGGLLSNAKSQIKALATLGRARRPETVPAVLRCLHAKEPTVSSAAETALAQFVTPPPSPQQYDRIMQALFEEKKLLRGEGLERTIEVITRSFPKLPPYDEIFRKRVGNEVEEGALRHRLLGAIRPPKSAAPPPSLEEGAPAKGAEKKEAALPSAEAKLDAIQLKREYLEKRRAWIKGGKQGSAPDPPPGMA